MIRRLDFNGDKGATRYEYVYSGILGTRKGFQAPSETRIIAKCLDKLEAIGMMKKDGGTTTFGLNLERSETGKMIDLQEEEYALMTESLKHTIWMAAGVRLATDGAEWWLSIPSIEPVE